MCFSLMGQKSSLCFDNCCVFHTVSLWFVTGFYFLLCSTAVVCVCSVVFNLGGYG